MRCRNCDAVGHVGRDCDKPRDWSRVKCRNCNNYGHGEKRCPEPVGAAETSGGWGDDGGASSAAVSGWGGDADSGAGAQESSGNWADDVNAVAEW
jgi:cellular nucleic acid-binding protein